MSIINVITVHMKTINSYDFHFLFHFFHLILILMQRMDLGECPKVHDLALRADYENAAKHKDYYYDIDVSN